MPDPKTSLGRKRLPEQKLPSLKRHRLAPDRPQARKRRLNKRTVTFDPVAIQTSVYQYDKVHEKEAPFVWWTRDEIRHIQKREKSMVGILSYFCGEYLDSLARLTEIAYDDVIDIFKERCYLLVANSPGRGLETAVSSTLTGTKSSSSMIRNVVETQQLLRGLCTENGIVPSPELFNEILRHQYVGLSGPKKRFAQLLAAGDALVSRFNEDEGLQMDNSSVI